MEKNINTLKLYIYQNYKILCKFETIMIFFNLNFFFLYLFFRFFFSFNFFFSNSNFTFHDLRLLGEKITVSIDFIVISFTFYEFYKELRLFKNI